MIEKWLPVKGYEGKYEVSNTGKVRGVDRVVSFRGSSKKQRLKERFLKQNKRKNGYMGVALCENGKIKGLSVHRLVAIAFIENKCNKKCVNHIDSNRGNNMITNLEWVTHK